MSKLIINKHQICYIPEYNLYLQRVGVDNTSVRHTCERIHIVFLIQDNYSGKDIKDQIIEYEVQNLSPTVTSQIGDPEFLEE